MGAMQRNKGAVFERETAILWRRVDPRARRGIGQARAGNEVPDVDVHGWWPECKRGRRTNPRAALAQAIEASKGTARVPVAVCRDDDEEAFIHMRFSDFLDLLARVGSQ